MMTKSSRPWMKTLLVSGKGMNRSSPRGNWIESLPDWASFRNVPWPRMALTLITKLAPVSWSVTEVTIRPSNRYNSRSMCQLVKSNQRTSMKRYNNLTQQRRRQRTSAKMTLTTMISNCITTKTITINTEKRIPSTTILKSIMENNNTIKVNRRDLPKPRPTLLVPITTRQDSLKTITRARSTPQPVLNKFKTIVVEDPPIPSTVEFMRNLAIMKGKPAIKLQDKITEENIIAAEVPSTSAATGIENQ